MIYNTKLKKEQTMVGGTLDCLDCPHFKSEQPGARRQCKGLGKRCFEMDKLTGNLLDPYTKTVIQLDMIKEEGK